MEDMQRTEAQEEQLDRIFSALSDRTRRSILLAVSRKTCTVSELAQPHNMSLPAISKHLKILERAGLISKEKEGRIYRCNLKTEALAAATELIAYYKKFWESRFDALEAFMVTSGSDENAEAEAEDA